jgi:hypothetical protein
MKRAGRFTAIGVRQMILKVGLFFFQFYTLVISFFHYLHI